MAGANLFNGLGTSTRIHPHSHCATWGLNYLIHKVYCRTLDLMHPRNRRSKTWIFHRYSKNAVQIVAFYHLFQDDCYIYIYTSADRKYTQLDYISFHMNYFQNFLHFGSNGQTRIQISYLEVARVGRLIPKRPEVWCFGVLFLFTLVMTHGNGQSLTNGGLYLRKSSINGGFSSKLCFITRGYPDSMQIRFGAAEKTIIPKRGDWPTPVVSWFVNATNDSYTINATYWSHTPA